MALVKYGQGVASMSGKQGGSVHARGRTGATIKNWTKPINAMSAKQTQRRVTFQAQSAAWGNLTDVQRDQWDAFAATQVRLNRQGDVYVPTGRQMYAELNANLELIGAVSISVPPVGEVPPTIESSLLLDVSETAGVLDGLDITGGAVDATVKWLVKAAPAQMTGRRNVRRQLRTVGFFAAGATVNVLAAYTAIFGTVAPLGATIQVEVNAVTIATGLASAKLTIEGVAHA